MVKVRPAVIDDLPRLLHLWQERQIILNQSDKRFTTPTPADHAAWEAEISERIQRGANRVLVGEAESGEVAGYISGEVRDGVGVVDHIALDAHTYHPGLGRALWEALRTTFTDQDITTIRIIVPRYHAVEQAFWLALRATPWQPTTDTDKDSWKIPQQTQWMTWSSGQ